MKKIIYSTIIVLIILCILNIDNSEAQWIQTPGIPPGGGITDIVVSEIGYEVVARASYDWPNGQDGGFSFSTNNGQTWNSPENAYNARTLALGQNGWIFGSIWDFPSDERLKASTDNGQTWSLSLHSVGPNNNIFTISVLDSNINILIGTRTGVHKSTDGGINFIPINNGIPQNTRIYDISSSNSKLSGIIAAAGTSGVYFSTNAGSKWTKANGISPSDTAFEIEFFPEGILVSTGTGNLFISNIDDYLNFSFLWSFPDEEIVQFQVFLSSFIVWTFGGGVYRSTDAGVTWTQQNQGLPTSNPPVSAGFLYHPNNHSENGNTLELYCGLFENSLNGAKVFTMDYTIGIQSISSEIPEKYLLGQNYPNPFNPETKINFNIKDKSFVKITVFDALGKELDELVNEELSPGTYQTNFNGSGYNSGVYFYRLTAGNYTETKKMLLIK